MAVHNASGDAANTAVRAFLTKVGEHYLDRSYNTGSGKGKDDWMRIKNIVFKNKCAYCDTETESLQIEHLVKFNRTECGLHHPGNTVPVCKPCNTSTGCPLDNKTNAGTVLSCSCIIRLRATC